MSQWWQNIPVKCKILIEDLKFRDQSESLIKDADDGNENVMQQIRVIPITSRLSRSRSAGKVCANVLGTKLVRTVSRFSEESSELEIYRRVLSSYT